MYWLGLIAVLGLQQEAVVTRLDLARSLMRLERAMLLAPPPAEKVSGVNKQFDRATLAFFAGGYQQAIQQIDQLVFSLEPAFGSTGARVAASVRWQVVPPFAPSNQQVALEIRCVPLYPLEDGIGDTKLTIKLKDAAGAQKAEYPIVIPSTRKASADILLPEKGLDVGTYALEIWFEDAFTAVSLPFFVLGAEPSRVGSEASARLASLSKLDPKLSDAMASCVARARVLSAPFGTEHELCTDLPALLSDVPQEVAKLEAGLNPFASKAGDTWRVRRIGDKEAPFRMYVPPPPPGGGPRPLLLSFHGAGGDEHMFLSAYGSGAIRELANQRGFVVVAPRTSDYLGKPDEVRKLLALVFSEQAIDRSRVYVLGHSLGGGLASQLAAEMSDVFAAACCFASAFGMPKAGIGKVSPTLVITGKSDAVVPAASVRALVEKVQQAKLPVELVTVSDYGHTLLVGAHLPFAVDWLLSHRLPSR